MRSGTISSARQRLSAVIVFGCILALFVSFLIRQCHTRVGHDQMSYLFEAQRFLSGDEIYGPHLSETNPPIIIWFSAPAVLLAGWLHSSPGTIFRALIAVMVLACTLWCVSILYRTRSSQIKNSLSLGLIGCAIVMVLFAVGGYDFGQREHLFIILLLPYVFASTAPQPSLLSRAEQCILGICAGLAVWFKPHDVLVVVALEFYLALRIRSLRRLTSPEFLLLVFTCVLLFVLVLVATPLYRTATLPLLFDAYWALGTTNTIALALSTRGYILIVLLAFAAWFLVRKRLFDPTTSFALLLASVAASVAYDLQHTDWQYHRYPYRALLLLAIAYLSIDLLSPLFARIASTRRLATLALAAVLLCALSGRLNAKLPNYVFTEVDPVFSRLPPSTTVYALSTGVPPLASAYYFHLNWGGRFAHLWMIPAIIQNETGPKEPPAPFKRLSPETVARLAALQRSETTEDLNRWKPAVVLIEHCRVERTCQGLEGKNFDLLAWFQQSPDFAAAWSHYHRQPSTLERFDVYTRTP